MAKLGGQRFPLPPVADAERICFTVSVPNEMTHISNFIGAIQLLSRWNMYITDKDHPSNLVANTWREILLSLQSTDCTLPPCPLPIEEWIEEMTLCDNLRFNAAGKLQVLCCGQWVNVDGQPSQGIGGPGQPGGGSPLPPPNGGCQSYHATLNGNDQWLAPPVVNAGDVITVSNLQGAWNDGTVLWFCPDGKEFFAGSCTTSTTLSGGDPIPTQPHMAVLSKIAGVYHNISDGMAFTVPGGVSNALLIFQANDATLSDNSGQITFDVNICNNQQGAFTHTFDFALSPSGFSVYPEATTPPYYGQWQAGNGWVGTQAINGAGNTVHGIIIHIVLGSSVTLTDAGMSYNLAKGTLLPGLTNELQFDLGGALVTTASVSSTTDADGTGKVLTIPHGSYVTDEIYIAIHDAYYASGADGSSAVLRVTVSGLGVDPF